MMLKPLLDIIGTTKENETGRKRKKSRKKSRKVMADAVDSSDGVFEGISVQLASVS